MAWPTMAVRHPLTFCGRSTGGQRYGDPAAHGYFGQFAGFGDVSSAAAPGTTRRPLRPTMLGVFTLVLAKSAGGRALQRTAPRPRRRRGLSARVWGTCACRSLQKKSFFRPWNQIMGVQGWASTTLCQRFQVGPPGQKMTPGGRRATRREDCVASNRQSSLTLCTKVIVRPPVTSERLMSSVPCQPQLAKPKQTRVAASERAYLVAALGWISRGAERVCERLDLSPGIEVSRPIEASSRPHRG